MARAQLPDLLLRVGCTMVAWMVIYAHLLWVAVLPNTGCTDGDALWRLTLGFAPVALGFALLLRAVHVLPEIYNTTRYFALPAFLLVLLAARAVATSFTTNTLNGASICDIMPSPAWHAWWAPVQVVVLALLALQIYRAWRPMQASA